MPKRNSGSVTDTSKTSDGGSFLKDDLLSIPEEEGYENSDDLNELKEYKLPPKTGEYYYQDYKYVKPTQSDFDHKEVREGKLFKKFQKSDLELENKLPDRDASILVSGFGMRNVDSFQKLVHMSQEERRKWELRKLWRDKQEQEKLEREKARRDEALATDRSDTTVTSTSTRGTRRSSSDSLVQTDSAKKDTDLYDKQRPLDYLLGLETELEEEGQDEEAEEQEEEEELEDAFKYSSSKSIREAQRYLRVHRVFECFQFIVAHLLSANPENPIEFILNLLNKCLLYRSGLGDPPLLYERRHIGQLFNLMDRLQGGFIDFAQYKSGMKTLAICSYNETPDINVDDLISKETFIEEAYEAELAIFDELLRKRPEKNKKKDKAIPSIFESVSVTSVNPPYFIPSALLGFYKKGQVDDVQDYYEA